MKLVDGGRLSLHIFRHNKLRTIFTVLAVSISIGVIVFLVSLGYGLQRLTVARIAGADSLVSIDVRSVDPDKPLDEQAAQRVKEIVGVSSVDPVVRQAGHIVAAKLVNVEVWGVASNFFELEGLSFQLGRPFSDGAVVSNAVVELLGWQPQEALGKTIELAVSFEGQTQQLKIEGITQESLTPAVYFSRAKLNDLPSGNYHSLKVKVSGQDKIESVKQAIAGLGFQAQATIDDISALKRGFSIARIVFAILGLIALVVSSIGMLNTMTISLLERTKEIGIMKALGAADSDVWLLFLTEASLIGFMGGIAGLVEAKIAATVFNFSFNLLSFKAGGPLVDLFETPPAFGLAMIVFAVLVGALTGIYPARRAARLNPLQALRYE